MGDRLRTVAAFAALAWRADRRRLIALCAIKLTSSVHGALTALWVKLMVDGLTARSLPGMGWPALALAASVASVCALSYAAASIESVLTDKTNHLRDLRVMELVAGASGLEVHEHPDVRTQLSVFLGSWEMGQVIPAAMDLFQHTVRIVVTAILYVNVHPALLALPLFGLPSMLLGSSANEMFSRGEEEAAPHLNRAGHLFDLATTPAPAKELRVFGLGAEIVERFREACRTASDVQRRMRVRSSAIGFGARAVFVAGFAWALWFVTSRALRGELTSGDVVLTVMLANQVMGLMFETADILKWALRTLHLAGCYVALERFIEKVSTPGQSQAPAEVRDGIELHAVSLQYPQGKTEALRDVSLRLPRGCVVAIVGENGAGKSTLVKLLLGLYRPTGGRITVDGVDLSSIDPQLWRVRTSAAFQDFVRYDFTCRENVGIGDLARLDDDAAVLAALERAGAPDVPAVLPNGLETQLGVTFTDGTDLSGGQWQKLALARAMMPDVPLLLVLDEPTASLDPQTEHALFERYASAVGSNVLITVLVSHRFSTVRMADLIVVVDGGRIVEQGSHAELMALGGLYAELYEIQARAYR